MTGRCTHPLYSWEKSRAPWRRHRDGRPFLYTRCATCKRVLHRTWERWPYNAGPLRKVRLLARWRLR